MASSQGSISGAFSGEITFNWYPEPIVIANQLRTMAGALMQMEGPLEGARAISQQNIGEHFDTKTGPDGQSWPEWSESYAESGRGVELLEQSGALRAAATAPSAFHINVWNGGGELFFDADLPSYGLAHHSGLSGRTNRWGAPSPLPARPFIGLSEDAEIAIVETFDAWVGSIVGGFSSGIYVHEHTPSHWVQTRLPSGRWGPRIK